jgi:glycerol-3-phosphate dehydrogenase subunit C
MSKKVEEMVARCVRCGRCTEVCPFYRATGDERNGAMGKVEAAKVLFDGGPPSAEDLKTLLLCTRCDRCVQECPAEVSVPDIVQSARAELRRIGLWPEKCLSIVRSIVENGSPMAAAPQERLACLPLGFEPPEKAEYLYVPGCWSGLKLPETARASLQLLIETGLDVTVLGDKERCCGLFLIDNGMMDEAKVIAEENTLLLESTSAKVVIAECPGCYDVFKHVYPQLFREPQYKVVFISEVLRDLIEHGKLKVRGSGKRVIYKDPCPLARRHAMLEAPRQVLGSVAEVVEFDEHGKDAVCCGAPAGVKALYPEIADKLAKDLMDEVAAKGVEEVGMSCAFCIYHMRGTVKDPHDRPRIRSLSQLVLESVEDRS